MASNRAVYRPFWWERDIIAAILHSAKAGGTHSEIAERVGHAKLTGKALARWLNAQRSKPGCEAYATFTKEFDRVYVNRTSVSAEQDIAAELEAALGMMLSLCDCGAVKEVYSDEACVECLRLDGAARRGVPAKAEGGRKRGV